MYSSQQDLRVTRTSSALHKLLERSARKKNKLKNSQRKCLQYHAMIMEWSEKIVKVVQ
jgi:hypothetical protein